MRIQNDDLWCELWDVVSEARNRGERAAYETPTGELVDEVFQVLSRRGLTGRPPAE